MYGMHIIHCFISLNHLSLFLVCSGAALTYCWCKMNTPKSHPELGLVFLKQFFWRFRVDNTPNSIRILHSVWQILFPNLSDTETVRNQSMTCSAQQKKTQMQTQGRGVQWIWSRQCRRVPVSQSRRCRRTESQQASLDTLLPFYYLCEGDVSLSLCYCAWRRTADSRTCHSPQMCNQNHVLSCWFPWKSLLCQPVP